MANDLVMPRLSDTMEEGTVLKWLKKEGDPIKKGEPILEVATDKANMELEAFDDGILDKIVVQEGETVAIGSTIATLRKEGEAPSAGAAQAAPAQPVQPAPAQPQAAPPEQPAQAAPAEPQEAPPQQPPAETPAPPPAEAQAAPAQPEVSAPAQPAEVQPAPAAPEPPREAEAEVEAEGEAEGRIKASPLAKRLAEEHEVDLAGVSGTGPGGRIIREDVEAFVAKGKPAAAPAAAQAPAPAAPQAAQAAPAAAPAPTPVPAPGETVALTRMQETIVRRMVESKTTVPHFYVTNEIDMVEAGRLRRAANESAKAFEAQEISYNDIVIKAAALTLRRFPEVNASYKDGKIEMHADINVGVAVAMPEGLVVVVVRNADKKNLRQIAIDAKEAIERARAGRMRPEDYVGGTFTVSNLGMFDVDEFIAIINPPQSGILAVGAVKPKPVVVDGEIKVSDRMRVTLSADHRVYYGATAAQFLKEFKRLLESPMELVL